MSLKGKTIVITGGASGIGRATVLKCVGLGASVFIGDINEKGAREVTEKANGLAQFVKLDLEDSASIGAFVEVVRKQTGSKIDGLVNTAGWDKVEPFIKNDPAMWTKVMAINLTGAIHLSQLVAIDMVAAKSGRIVNISSDAGRVGSSGEVVYAAAKGGLIAFTKGLAREMARYGVGVNCVCPGPTDTPLFHQQPDERIKEALVRAIPFRRLAAPSEIADAIAFFLDIESSSYITGQVLSVSGGLTMVG